MRELQGFRVIPNAVRNLSRFFVVLRMAAGYFLCLLPLATHAHGVRTDIRITLDAPRIAGLTVELHQGDIAPQIVLENRSGKTLEILDASGRAFLRIGPKQVEADVVSHDWKASLNPIERPARVGAPQKPRWRTIRKEPSYGWFDSRLDSAPIQIPKPVVAVGKPVKLQDWVIAARLDGKPFQIQGQFVYQPAPKGSVQVVMRSAKVLAPGIALMLASGVTPALLIQNRSAQTVSVLDAKGQAFLRIDSQGVRADTSSAAWQAASAIPAHPQQKAGWQKVSVAKNFSWLEPRLKYRGPAPEDPAQPQTLGEWRLPFLIDKQRVEVAGIYQWVPAPLR